MCMQFHDGPPEQPSGIGWKILMEGHDGKLYSLLYGTMNKPWTHEWQETDKNALPPNQRLSWEPGYHIYKYKAEAENTVRLKKQMHEASGYPNHNLQAPVVVKAIEYDKAFMEGRGDGGWNDAAHVILAEKARLADVPEGY